ncbi:hypothetical protein B0H14DRAFT_2834410 [Mycena olivaceomarginata]|nr:hypothetical protein B0H14DRAFT_2834410 [Mycena olivaceomarginata]
MQGRTTPHSTLVVAVGGIHVLSCCLGLALVALGATLVGLKNDAFLSRPLAISLILNQLCYSLTTALASVTLVTLSVSVK